jgi:preprotein translocase subunit SecD
LLKKKVLGRFILMGVLALAAVVYLLPNLGLYDRWPDGGLVDSLRASISQQNLDIKVERDGLNIAFTPETLPEEFKEVIRNSYPWLKPKGRGSYEISGTWAQSLPTRGLTLGLDLQGGLHVVFEVQGEEAVAITVQRLADSLKQDLAGKKIEAEVKADARTISVLPLTNEAKDIIDDSYPMLDSSGAGKYTITDREADRIKNDSVEQALETIRNRIDQFGVAEPNIHRQGTDEIVVQLPGVKDPGRIIDLMETTARLEFKMADDEAPLAAELPQAISPEAEAEVLDQFKDVIPDGDELLFIVNKDRTTREIISKTPILLKSKVELTGDLLNEANVSIDQRFNEPYVSLRFNPAGAKLFEEVTGRNVEKRMAIVLDGTVYSAPVIRERIAGGNAQISGAFSLDEAKDLAIVLKAGSLQAPMKMLQNVTVGSSLGSDSIDAGKKAGLIGLILVVGFMVVYYKISGLIADFALVLNILLLLGSMAMLEATLTLPGIAGVILAIGMAVDSNVLMFERMREELRAGKTPRAAVDSGYDKAFWTIFDSHVTTLITAVVLFQFGTGPIKGFAVTLSFGVAINLFTALVGTKTIFDYINSRTEVKRLSI